MKPKKVAAEISEILTCSQKKDPDFIVFFILNLPPFSLGCRKRFLPGQTSKTNANEVWIYSKKIQIWTFTKSALKKIRPMKSGFILQKYF